MTINETIVALTAVILGLSIPIAAIVAPLMILVWVLIKGRRGKNSQSDTDEESRLIQDIHHSLSRMSERIEALETILVETQEREK